MILKIKGPALDSTVGTLRGGGPRLAARVEKEIPESVSGPLDYLVANAGLKRVTPLFAKHVAHKVAGLNAPRLAAISSVADSPHEDLQGYTVVFVDPKNLTPKLMKQMRSKAISLVEQMPARWIAKRTNTSRDPMQRLQWGLKEIGWFEAKLPTTSQASRIKVAVLDSGVDTTHEDSQRARLPDL
jgi:hypothetical protein